MIFRLFSRCAHRLPRSVPAVLGTTTLVLLGSVSHVHAQTLFISPDTTVDYSQYRNGEECLAAIGRVTASERNKESVWQDTTFMERSEALEPLPELVIATAKMCAAHYASDTVPLDRFGAWVSVFLAANRDADANTVVRRRLAEIQTDDTLGRVRVLERALQSYLKSRPIRMDGVEAMMKQLEEIQTQKGFREVLSLYQRQLALAKSLRDTALSIEVAQRALNFVDSLSPEDKELTRNDLVGRYVVHQSLDILTRKELVDSLRQSASAYVALKRANLIQASGERPETLQFPVGERAEPIEGDFWFARGNDANASTVHDLATPVSHVHRRGIAKVTRPTPGRVGLILFLQGGCRPETPFSGPFGRQSWRSDCWDTYATLRRLAAKYPELEVTIVAQTIGYLGDTPPLSPEDEANMLQNWWFDFHHLPGTLAVTKTTFFHLPAPDNRRIDNVTANMAHYTFGSWWSASQKVAYLVDPSGVILHMGPLVRENESEFRGILDVVMQRYRSVANSGGEAR